MSTTESQTVYSNNEEPFYFEPWNSEKADYLRRIDTLERVIHRLRQVNCELSGKQYQLRTLIDTIPDYIYIKDEKSRFLINNRMHLSILGASNQKDVIGKTDFDFFDKETAYGYYLDEKNIIQTGNPIIDREETTYDQSGKQQRLSTTKVPIHDDNGRIVGVMGISRDITHRKLAEEERKLIEEKIHEHQKLEALGRLAGGIAHDFNNILSAINGYAELLVSVLSTEQPNSALYAKTILNASERAAGLIKNLLAFSRKNKSEFSAIDSHAIINDVVTLLKHSVDKRIEIIRDFHADHAVIMGDSGQLHNALLNLAVNACDAMPSGGKLILSTAEHAITDNHEAVIEKKLRPGHYVSLTVTDTGCGMDEIIRKRIFEPFFTTKSPGKGTGLGLAGVYRTVINHSGSIDVISMPGRGTVFTISLPAALDNTCHDTTKNRTVWKGSGRVLLVDDEAFVRDVTTRQLTRLGYTVTTCEDGVQALKYYAQHREEVDVVIMDLVMPMLNGVECIAKMKKLNPDVKIIDCTGTNPGIDTSLLMTNKVEEIIRKPFSLSELSQCVLRVCSLPDMPSPFPEQMGG